MKTKKITIPQPCNQQWSAMQEEGEGRFCGSCQKTVIDFSKYNDEDFITYFQKTTTLPCGRFTKRQLDLAIPVQPTSLLRPANLYRYVAASLLSITVLSTQAQTAAFAITQSPVTPGNAAATTAAQEQQDMVTFRGKILNENKEGVPGASVHIENNSAGTITDIDGMFSLSLSAQERASGILVIKSLGYVTIKTAISTLGDNATLKLAPDEQQLMGDIVIIRTPNLWQRITRPFRRGH